MAPVLGYWKLRGLGQPIRLLLAHVNQEYEDKLYVFGPGPEFDRSDWLDKKFKLGLDFPNLPYYIDGDLKLTQSSAILRYLADKHKLNPETAEQKRRVYEVEYQIEDLKWGLFRLFMGGEYEKAKGPFIDSISATLKLFSDFLKKDDWLSGDKVTYVDFIFYEALQWYDLIKPDCFNEFENLKNYVARFEALPNISKYMKSDRFIRTPFFGPQAPIGGGV